MKVVVTVAISDLDKNKFTGVIKTEIHTAKD